MSLLQKLHELNFCHGDVKLENIVVGHDDPGEIFLLDFGLSTPLFEPNGLHVEKKQLNRFCGNYVFASLGTCRGYNKSRKDDIESAFYVLIYLLNQKQLPWRGLEAQFTGANSFQKSLKERLRKKYTLKLFPMIPQELQGVLREVLCLNFD